MVLATAPLARPACAAERIAGPVEADIVEIIDGDSLRVRARVWPGHFVEVILRVRGIDTPELRAACQGERALALAARATLQRLVGREAVTLVNIGGGKYFGRVLADVRLADGSDLTARMLDAAPARIYHGGRRAGWCPRETNGSRNRTTPSPARHVAVQNMDSLRPRPR